MGVIPPTFALRQCFGGQSIPHSSLLISHCLWPVQVFAKKAEGTVLAHRVTAVENLNIRFVFKIELIVNIFHFPILIKNPFIWLDKVVMASLNHKRSWENKVGHFSITEC